MAFPKLVGFSFGVEEQTFSSVKRQNGFENEDRRRNSTLELALGINGRKEDVGGGYFPLHESFSGSSKDVNEKERVLGFRNLNVKMGGNGMPEISNSMSKQVIHDKGSDRMQKKNGAIKKCVSRRGDHTWLPEQGNSVSSSVSKRMKPNQFKNRKPLVIEDDGVGVSESDIQNMANPNSLKSILLSCGWMVVAQEGRDASYVSPSGSIYGSLQKALEVFSRDASKFAERQCCLSQSVVSSRDNVAQRTPKIKRKSTSRRTRTVVQPVAENAALHCHQQQHQEQGHQRKQQQQHHQQEEEEQQKQSFGEECDKELSRLSVRRKWNRNKCLTGVIIELDSSDVHLVVMDKKLKFCTKDEGLSGKKHASNCLGLTETTNNHNGSAAMYLNRSVRESGGLFSIKGRRVPVDDELMGVWFDEYMKTGPPGPENMKYRQVTELLASSMGEEKVVKKSGIGASAYPEEMAFGELHREKAKSCSKDDCSSNETNWSEWINEVATNGQSGNSKLQLDCDFTRARRSKRIKRRHIPVGCVEYGDVGIWQISRLLLQQTCSSIEENLAKTMTTGKYLSYRSKRKPVSSRCSNEKEKTKRSGGCSLTVRTRIADFEDTPLSETKLTILSWLIDSQESGVTAAEWFLSLSKFEVHAGSNLRRPWKNIRLISGKSLMQCHSEAWEKEKDIENLFLPEGSWYCPYCSCRFCSRGDRWHDKSYRAMNLVSCNHCGCKYHRDCVTKNDVDSLGTNSQAYCGKLCKEVASGLSDILGVSNPISGGFSWVLVKHLDEVEGTDSKRTQSSMMECHCFVPLIDPRSSLDMITQAVYNCGLHGSRVAEMPFIGTRPLYRQQGMCRRLLNAIEEILSKLHVENLILPATPDMLGTWTKSFSFQHLALSCKDEFRNLNIVQFADTTILQKSIHCRRDVNQFGVTDTYTQDVLNCSTPEYRIEGSKVATLGLCEEMKASTNTHDTPFPALLEASRGSGFDVYPVQSPLYQNINKNSLILASKTTTLTPVDNIIMTKISIRPETVSLGSRNLLMSAGC
ncbi:hypothetical protein MKW92_051822 [Papaver armeniacum]|nr:hypothetical protein MKW92_051822 [Papaver armeniacum]